VHSYENEEYKVCEILKGDYFGHGNALKIFDYTYYGDVYAKTDVTIFYLSDRWFKKLPKAELERLKSMQGKSTV
jgi:hypothetical protein